MLEDITILYVEDDENIAEEIQFFLSQKVKKLYLACDGVEGLEFFNKYEPDIIITDIEMPRLNGFNMIEAIKQKDATIPIIVTSAFSETNKLLRAIELGIDTYLIKPINLKNLFQKIKNLTESQLLEKKMAEIDVLEAKEKELRKAQKNSQILLEEQNMLLSLFDKGESVLFKWKNDEHWTIEYASRNVEKLFPGYGSLSKESKMHFVPQIHKDDFQRVLEVVQNAIDTDQDSFTHEPYRIISTDNKVKWVMDNTVTQKDSNGNIAYFIGNILDITEKKSVEKKIENYLSIIDENIISVSTDLDGVITEVSAAFCKLVGYTKQEIIGETHRLFKDPSVDSQVYKELWDTIIHNNTYKGELRNIDKNGFSFWMKVKILPLYDDSGVKRGYFSIKQNITDKKLVEKLSITDDLTKLYNRRHFNELFQQELNRVKRDHNTLAFVMIDIDFFKLYNDTYGHQAGDDALIQVARVLKDFTNRAGDNAFRLGGEEFGLILISKNNEKIEKHLQTLLNAIEELSIEHKNSSVSKHITASLGYVLTTNEANVDELYKKADNALYRAKTNGRNQAIQYS